IEVFVGALPLLVRGVPEHLLHGVWIETEDPFVTTSVRASEVELHAQSPAPRPVVQIVVLLDGETAHAHDQVVLSREHAQAVDARTWHTMGVERRNRPDVVQRAFIAWVAARRQRTNHY